MAENSEGGKPNNPNVTSSEHLRRQERLARRQIRLRGIRTIVWSLMASALFAYVFSAPYTEWVLVGAVIAVTATMLLERHLIHRYLIETLADEIVYLTIVAHPGHCAITYATRLATIPTHEVHGAITRLAHAHRIGGEREIQGGHELTLWRPTHG